MDVSATCFVHQTLFTSAKLKVFDVLNSSNGLTLEEVASQINASVFGTERLLDAAVSLGLLEKVKQQDDKNGKSVVIFFSMQKLSKSCFSPGFC